MIQTAFIGNAGQGERDAVGYSDYSRVSNLQVWKITQGHVAFLFNGSSLQDMQGWEP